MTDPNASTEERDPLDDPGASPRQRESRRLALTAWEGPLLERVIRCPRCGVRPRETVTDPDAPPIACARCGVDPTSVEAGDQLRARGGKLSELIRGAAALPRGMLWLLKSGAVLRSAKIPLLIGLVLSVAVFVVASQWVVPWLIAPNALASLEGIQWAPLRAAVNHLGMVVGWYPNALLFLVVGWLLVGFPGGIVAQLTLAPFLEHLSEDAEAAVLALPEADAEASEARRRSIGVLLLAGLDGVFLLLLQAALYIVCLPVALIPVAGGVLWLLLPPVLLAGLDGSDGVLVRKGYGPRARLRLWRVYRWRFIGFGLAFFAVACVPLLNALLLPAAVVSGTLLYLELPRK